ncbi:glycosyltransferase family 2 protein [Haloarcula sp. S1CR25-12]|uniref:Glycosyltransferase family 2 protein n=1 Tax=Haloarcula saliterrae TaxID=2950534 RepID=A0ABU2FHZ3_9EURY|nr:glycosyltransferase family 2 protein [Haloarcula sp. S1CR25-12]MDS0261351.1 glycosyltransferase family 2 protein [Haloarcula sp. S1CR25-12]
MYKGHTVGVVVPAYNEAAFVGDVIAEIPAFVDHVYAIDDASTDETMAAMTDAARERSTAGTVRDGTQPTERAATRPSPGDDETPPVSHDGGHELGVEDDRVGDSVTIGRVTCLRHATNRGAGGAIKTGYAAALADGMDIVATIDGDGQMDSTTLPGLLEPLVSGAAGYAKGNRFSDGEITREMPPFRLLGNVLLTGLTRMSTGYWGLLDPQNGFTAATREALLAADAASIWEYYGYMNQLTARFNAVGVDIADVPMETEYGDEESDIEYLPYIRKVSALLVGALVRRLGRKRDAGATATAACYLLAVVCFVGCAVRALRRGGGAGMGLASVVGVTAGALVDRVSGPTVVRWEEEP